jgi:hypothetical protein
MGHPGDRFFGISQTSMESLATMADETMPGYKMGNLIRDVVGDVAKDIDEPPGARDAALEIKAAHRLATMDFVMPGSSEVVGAAAVNAMEELGYSIPDAQVAWVEYMNGKREWQSMPGQPEWQKVMERAFVGEGETVKEDTRRLREGLFKTDKLSFVTQYMRDTGKGVEDAGRAFEQRFSDQQAGTARLKAAVGKTLGAPVAAVKQLGGGRAAEIRSLEASIEKLKAAPPGSETAKLVQQAQLRLAKLKALGD